MAQAPPDGSLSTWAHVEGGQDWKVLLVGNGLSINVWKGFRYGSLYKEARRLGSGGLASKDNDLFNALKTENFERVLGDVGTAVRVQGALGRDTTELLARYQSIQNALGEAIREVHIPWTDVPATSLGKIQDTLVEYDWVFTVNYDLLLYWAMMYENGPQWLVDCFWGQKCRFSEADSDVRAGKSPVFFLHGAMHLIVEASGRTRKLIRTDTQTLLDQFGQPIAEDPRARPLMVTEGSAQDKRQAIDGNDYLAHAFRTFQAPDTAKPLVIFGCSLGAQDQHLIDALNVHPSRPIAISMLPGEAAGPVQEAA